MADSSAGLARQPGRAKIFAARFDDRSDAGAVRRKLESLGYDPAEISSISDPEKCSFTLDGAGNRVPRAGAEGLLGGAVFGGGVGATTAALGLGGLVILGPIGTITGLLVGGLVGLLLGAGLDSDQAAACRKAVTGGSLVMTVQAHTGDDERVAAALGRHVIATEDDVYF